MCDEFIEVFEKLKNDVSDDEKKYIKESKVYFIKRINHDYQSYKWKEYDKVIFFKNYDSISHTLRTGGYNAPITVGKRKLDKVIHVTGLPKHCYK